MAESEERDAVCLGARNVTKRYGPVVANDDVTLSLERSQIHAVVGENGAGKSTLMRIFQGLEQPDSGTVVLDGRRVRLRNPQQALNLGIGMVHQEFMLAPDLTLLENMVLGDEPGRSPMGSAVIDWGKAREESETLQGMVGVEIDWNRKAALSAVHIQQYVEILRLMRRGSNILILDEPTAVLAPQQVIRLFDVLRELRDRGNSILFISHKLKEVTALADHVSIMRRGRVVASAPIREIDIETMTRHIVGGNMQRPQGSVGSSDRGGKAFLRVINLNIPSIDKSRPVHDVSFEVRSGEIVGIAGVAGNGQEELIECMVGLRGPSSGSIRVGECELAGASNAQFRACSVGFVSPDRAREGLARTATVEDNVMAGSQRNRNYYRWPFRRMKAVRLAARKRLDALDVRYGALRDLASSLSGGNQQKLVFARETAAEPRLLVVSQPTRGVDLNGIAAIHEILRKHRAGGGAVILASEELDELIELCDRILVISGGRISGELTGDETTAQAIGRLMLAETGPVHG